jgi:hypothetical protein
LHDLKLGIDSWSYHRYLGKISDTEPFTGIRWTTEQFLNRAKDLGAQGVSLETILLESTEGDYISKLRVLLDRFDMKRILAWVHPEFALSRAALSRLHNPASITIPLIHSSQGL